MRIDRFVFRIGRRIGKHPLAGRLFCGIERFLPLTRIVRHGGLVAFHHPRPIADLHVLIVPTTPMASLNDPNISDERLAEILWRMAALVPEVEQILGAGHHTHLVINGGARQDIGQLHAHLLAGDPEPDESALTLTDPEVGIDDWKVLRRTMQEAERSGKGGFSLILKRFSGDQVRALVQ